MGLESKGRAWFGKIYNKLETLLVEVDSFTTQSTLCLKPSEEVAEQGRSSVSYNVKQHHDDRVASPRCESLFDPPSHQNFDMPGHVVVEIRVQEDIFQENLSASSFPDGENILSTSPLLEDDCDATLVDEKQLVPDEESQVLSDGETHSTSSLLEEYHDANLTSATTIGDEVTDEDSQVFPNGEALSTSPLLEGYHDANLTSATTVGDEETIVTLTPQKFSDQPKEAAEDSSSEASIMQQDHDPVDSPSCKTPSDQPKEAAEDSSSEASILQQDHDPVDSQSCKIPSDQPKQAAEDSSSEASAVQQDLELDSPSCKSPSDPPSHQNFDISEHVLVEERVQGDILHENLVQEDGFKENSPASSSLSDQEILSTSPLLEEYWNTSLTSASTIGDEESIITDDESQITNTLTTQNSSPGSSSVFPGGERVEEVRVKSSLPDGEMLSTSSLLEDYCDANLTSTTTLADEEPLITDDESRITNTFIPHKVSPGNPSVSPCGESVEEVGDVSFRDIVSTESQSTQSSMKSFGTVVKCNDDPVLPALGIFMDNDSSPNDPLATKIADGPVQDNVANMRSSNAGLLTRFLLLDVMNDKSDVAPMDINALYHIDFREDPSYVDNNAMRVKTISPLDTNALNSMQSREDPLYVDDSVLYAMHLRTKKLRSFKRKILDALTSKRRREKEYEQLAIWFGDAEMGSDLSTEEDSKQVKAIDSKSSRLLESEDSQWELL
ncbi:PREDICTED: mucin-1-like isoform X2 [Camelina sativa]|uniref:Mucin-1-like isoform X2 n=1 Tax=Camelina sativa TaxID=90675 RepID=A0ABM0WI10_CAMSA|nr:PREDICTED: mucin-1-like isoform X2 [Camelina sativa]